MHKGHEHKFGVPHDGALPAIRNLLAEIEADPPARVSERPWLGTTLVPPSHAYRKHGGRTSEIQGKMLDADAEMQTARRLFDALIAAENAGGPGQDEARKALADQVRDRLIPSLSDFHRCAFPGHHHHA